MGSAEEGAYGRRVESGRAGPADVRRESGCESAGSCSDDGSDGLKGEDGIGSGIRGGLPGAAVTGAPLVEPKRRFNEKRRDQDDEAEVEADIGRDLLAECTAAVSRWMGGAAG